MRNVVLMVCLFNIILLQNLLAQPAMTPELYQQNYKTMKDSQEKNYAMMVYLKNGEVLHGKSYIQYPTQHGIKLYHGKHAIITLDGRKIRPFETDSISIDYLTGIPVKKIWVFKVIDGKISAYSKTPDREAKNFEYIKKGEGPREVFSKELLRKYVKSNKLALLCTEHVDAIKPNFRRAILEYNDNLSSNRPAIDSLYALYIKKKVQKTTLFKAFKKGIRLSRADSLCKAAKKVKNSAEKIKILEGAIKLKLEKDLKKVYLELGDLYLKQDNKGAACKQYNNYLRYENNHGPQYKEIQTKIKKLGKKALY